MIDLEHETALPLSEAPRHPMLRRGRRAGRPIHRATLERWRTRGVSGVVLETVKVGGIRFTTFEAIERFITRLTRGGPPDAPSPSQIAGAHRAAEQELVDAGI